MPAPQEAPILRATIENPNIPALLMDTVDGVDRFPRTGIRVLVVGGGVGGLMAALECWRKGHDVQVLERSNHFSSIGDFFSISPSALTTLKYYPKLKADYEKEVLKCQIRVHRTDGAQMATEEPEWDREGAPQVADGLRVSFVKRRSDVAKMLLDQCDRLGIDVKFGKRVVKYEENINAGDGTVRTDTNAFFTADVVIAADGVGTKSNPLVRGAEVKAMPTGYAILRVAYSRDLIRAGSPAEKMLPKLGERPKFDIHLGPDMHCITFSTDDTVGIAFTHPDVGIAEESWHRLVSPDLVLEKLREKGEWDPALLSIIAQIPGEAIDWKLTWRDPQPVWTSDGGRIVQLGDAAHSFLPTSGNGATQAMEDASSLAECLRLAGRANAHWATKVHERLRFQRTSAIQRLGFDIRTVLHHAMEPTFDPSRISVAHGRWIWLHNPEKYASEKYATAYAHLMTGAPFEDTNLPDGYIYRPWTMEDELDRERRGQPSGAKETGNWEP